jgi:magnesium-transporting ATPase (P-type)
MNTEGLARLIELPREDIFAALGSRPEGLTSDEVRERAARFGSNAIAETRGPGLVRRLGGQFVHLFALLLWAGSVLAILAGEVTWGQRNTASATVSAGATTVVFLAIVILQVGNAFACRTERTSAFARGLLSNRFLLLGVLFELLFAAALIYTPPFQRLFGTAALDPRWWLVLAAFIGPVFAVEEIRKLLLRRRSRDQGGRQTPTRRSAPG